MKKKRTCLHLIKLYVLQSFCVFFLQFELDEGNNKKEERGKGGACQASNATVTGALFLPSGGAGTFVPAPPPPPNPPNLPPNLPPLPASALPFSSTPRASWPSSSQALHTAPELSPPQRSHSPGDEEERRAAAAAAAEEVEREEAGGGLFFRPGAGAGDAAEEVAAPAAAESVELEALLA